MQNRRGQEQRKIKDLKKNTKIKGKNLNQMNE